MGRTALILAAAGGHLDIVDALLAAKGARIEDKDRYRPYGAQLGGDARPP